MGRSVSGSRSVSGRVGWLLFRNREARGNPRWGVPCWRFPVEGELVGFRVGTNTWHIFVGGSRLQCPVVGGKGRRVRVGDQPVYC